MNEEEVYLAEQIKSLVWSGFHDRRSVHACLDDLLDGDVDEAMLRALIDEEMHQKRAQEKDWPAQTDCDRLDAVFADLNGAMVIALQNAGYTTDEAHADVGELYAQRPDGTYRGYCFYHGQDLERAVAGEGIMLAFGDMQDTDAGKAAIAALIIDTLQRHGFAADWNGSVRTRINVPHLHWQRRLARGHAGRAHSA